MRRRLSLLRLPWWWLFRATRPAEWLVMDWSFVHGWGRRPPVPTPMLWFPLRCLGSEACPTCAANWQVVPLVEA